LTLHEKTLRLRVRAVRRSPGDTPTRSALPLRTLIRAIRLTPRGEAPLVILYDGVCGLCNGFVRFVARRDPHDGLRFAALDSPLGDAVRARHPTLAGIDSIVLVEHLGTPNECVSTRSDAALRIMSHLPWPSRTWGAARVLPRALRDGLYDLVARNRYRVFGRYDECPLPSAELRHRLIDFDAVAASDDEDALAHRRVAP
jgi:predicted DCC family thiol-disulfide oxidoreductase YuxK